MESRTEGRNREAEVERNTKETKIVMKLNLDGTGQASVHTGIGFFDHMLEGFARSSRPQSFPVRVSSSSRDTVTASSKNIS